MTGSRKRFWKVKVHVIVGINMELFKNRYGTMVYKDEVEAKFTAYSKEESVYLFIYFSVITT